MVKEVYKGIKVRGNTWNRSEDCLTQFKYFLPYMKP